MQDKKALVREYLDELILKDQNKTNIIVKKHLLLKFIHFLDSSGYQLQEIGIKQALDYQKYLINLNHYTPNTIKNYLYEAVRFYDFLKTKGLITTNPFKDIKILKQAKPLPKNILKEKEMQKLLDELGRFENIKSPKHKKIRYRVHIIAELMYASGLRIDEVCKLNVEDIDLNKKLIYVQRGKGGKSRTAFLSEYATQVLDIYIHKMRQILLDNNHDKTLLFGAHQRLKNIVNRELKIVCQKLNLPVMTSHGFRHAVGFHLLRINCDIRHIQAILGHDNISSTEVYTKVDKEDLKNVLDTFHPRTLKNARRMKL